MKRLLILLLCLPLAALAAERTLETGAAPGLSVDADSGAITIEPQPPTEDELINDDGEAHYRWSGGIAGFASMFEAPYDCYLVRIKLTCYNTSGRNYYLDVLGDDAGEPDEGNSLIGGYQTFYDDGGSGDRWVEFTLDEPLALSTSDIFYLFSDDSIDGLDNAPQDDQNPGPEGSAWWWQSSSWYDYDFFGAMLIRAIVDDDKGTDGTTIVVEVEETDVTADCTITDNGDGSFTVEYVPATEFAGAQEVEVLWEAEDGLGNFGSDEWTFTIQEDWNTVPTSWGALKADTE